MHNRDKEEVIHTIKKQRIVAIIRTGTPEKALKISEALIEGGIKALEFSYTMPFATRSSYANRRSNPG